MPVIRRNGVDLFYQSHGSGQAILLSHGYGNTADMWDPQIEALAAGHQVITWDMRGHARSGSPDDLAAYSEAEAVGDMTAILDACGAGQAVIGGLALGGYLSLCFWVAQPQRTRALILAGTGPGYRKDEARDAWNKSVDVIADALDTRGLDALDDIAWGRNPLHRSASGLALAARGMLKQDDAHVFTALPDISVPTLVVVGENDTDFLAPGSYMTKKIPGATEVVIAGAGHGCNMEKPAEFNQAVLDFLTSVK